MVRRWCSCWVGWTVCGVGVWPGSIRREKGFVMMFVYDDDSDALSPLDRMD